MIAIRSTQYVTLPEGLTAEKLEDSTLYDTAWMIYRDGEPIGVVHSRTVETSRKVGRLRWPTGHAKVWVIARSLHRVNYDTRAAAIKAMIDDIKEEQT